MKRDYSALEKAAKGQPVTKLSVKISTERPTTRLGLTEVEVCLDTVTEEMVEFFGHGQAWLLAGGLVSVSNWPLVLVTTRTGGYHMGVQTPAGDFLDIQGVRSFNEVREDYAWGSRVIVSPTMDDLRRVKAVFPLTWRERTEPDYFAEAIEFLAERLVKTALGQDDLGWSVSNKNNQGRSA